MKNAVQTAVRILFIMLGAALMLHVIVMSAFVYLNSGMILTFLLGVLCIAFAAFFRKLQQTRAMRWIYWAFGAGCFFMAGMIVFLSLYGGIDTVTYHEDAVIVLGAGIVGQQVTAPLAYRLDACVEYHQNNPRALIVVSGGQGEHEEIPESLAMKRYLVQRGIPQEMIVMEDQSVNTGENLRYSKQLLDQCFGPSYKTAVITNQFHIFRAAQLSKIAGFSGTTHLHAGLDFYNLPVSYIREVFGVLKMWVLQR